MFVDRVCGQHMFPKSSVHMCLQSPAELIFLSSNRPAASFLCICTYTCVHVCVCTCVRVVCLCVCVCVCMCVGGACACLCV